MAVFGKARQRNADDRVEERKADAGQETEVTSGNLKLVHHRLRHDAEQATVQEVQDVDEEQRI
jgi:hypothetical protein